MTFVYRSAIVRDAATPAPLFPQAVRHGVILHAHLTGPTRDDANAHPPTLSAALDIRRQRNANYRFLIAASQPHLEIAHYAVMSEQDVDAQLQWYGLDPTPTIAAVTALTQKKLDEGLRQEVPQPSAGDRQAARRTPAVKAMTLDEVYQKDGEFRYHIFPHELLAPLVATLRERIDGAAERPEHQHLENRVHYLPQHSPFSMNLRAYIDISAGELRRTSIADTITALVNNCVTMPFSQVEISYRRA